jgi:hypothetical protein
MKGALSRLGGETREFVVILAPSVYLSVPSYGTDPSGLVDRAEANSLVSENEAGSVDG